MGARIKYTFEDTLIMLKNEIYFGANHLNRLSFLRNDPRFIKDAITSSATNIIFFSELSPLVDTRTNKFMSLNYKSLDPTNRLLIDRWAKGNEEKSLHLLSQSPLVHFLGLDTTCSTSFKYNSYSGMPYFAVSLDSHSSMYKYVMSQNPSVEVLRTREQVNRHLDYRQASVYAQAKMYLEWLSTTRHCRGCGSRTIPINAGSELLCSNAETNKCSVKSAHVSNASFPRLDPVLICCVLNNH